MATENVGGWTKNQLNRFILSVVATEELKIPKAITVETVTVTKKLIVQGDIQVSPQAAAYIHNL